MVSRISNQPGPAVRVVSSFDETALDQHSWNQLVSQGTNTVFQSYQWHRSWWSAYGHLYEPLFVVVSNAATVTGVAPLVVEETTQGRIARFIGEGRSDYCDLLTGSDRHAVAEIIRGMCDYGRWDVMDLKNIPADSATVPMIAAACRDAGLPIIVRDQFVCPTLLVRGHERSARSILNKPALRRRQNRLERAGRLVCRDLSTAGEVEPYLEPFFEQHIARWRTTDTPSLFHDAPNRAFYRELTAQLDGTGWLLFSLVEVDDRPIAIHYGFDCHDAQIWYKPSFDPAWASKSPGLMLVRHLIGRAIDRGRREFDFTVGAEPFKLRFTNFARKTIHIQVFRDPARYRYERSKRSVIAAMRRVAANVANRF